MLQGGKWSDPVLAATILGGVNMYLLGGHFGEIKSLEHLFLVCFCRLVSTFALFSSVDIFYIVV